LLKLILRRMALSALIWLAFLPERMALVRPCFAGRQLSEPVDIAPALKPGGL
jgi:hypothetical protein